MGRPCQTQCSMNSVKIALIHQLTDMALKIPCFPFGRSVYQGPKKYFPSCLSYLHQRLVIDVLDSKSHGGITKFPPKLCNVCSSPPDRVAVIAYHANTWRKMRSCSLFLELDQIECSRRLNSVVVVVVVFVFG